MSENNQPISSVSSSPTPVTSVTPAPVAPMAPIAPVAPAAPVAPVAPAASAPAPAAAPSNYLSADVEITGTLTFRKDLVFDGKMDGEITSEANLTLGANARVEGEILTNSVVIRGSVNGNVTVDDKCELRGNAQLIGDLKASRLVMEESATLVGRSEVTPKKPAIARPEFQKAVG